MCSLHKLLTWTLFLSVLALVYQVKRDFGRARSENEKTEASGREPPRASGVSLTSPREAATKGELRIDHGIDLENYEL